MFAMLRSQPHPVLQIKFPIFQHPKRAAYHISLIFDKFFLQIIKMLITTFSPVPSKPTLERLFSSTPCPERFQNEGQNLTQIIAGKITVLCVYFDLYILNGMQDEKHYKPSSNKHSELNNQKHLPENKSRFYLF